MQLLRFAFGGWSDSREFSRIGVGWRREPWDLVGVGKCSWCRPIVEGHEPFVLVIVLVTSIFDVILSPTSFHVAIITCHYAVVDEGRKLRLKFRIYRGAYMVLCGCGARIAWSDATLRMRRVEFKCWDCWDNFKQNPMGQLVSSSHQWPRWRWYGKHDGAASMVISVFLPPHRYGVWISHLAMEAMGLPPSQRGVNGSVPESGIGMTPLARSARLE